MLVVAFILLYLAVLAVTFGVFSVRTNLPWERRRPVEAEPDSGLSRVTAATTEAFSSVLERRGWTQPLAAALERSGVKTSPSDFLVLVGSATVVALLLGFLLGGIILGLLFALTGPIGAKVLLSIREARRRRAFADQLDETLQLLAGGLRAGHSLLQAVNAVSHEAETPTDEEFARIINETRLGRDINDALEQSAQRMRSQDFGWVIQAIAIHREVGGDLASVLDEVGHTIRERNQIRRQVAALSAEGKMSAYILMALPLVVTGILAVTSTAYITKFIQSPIGFAMIAAALIMFTLGGLWMKKIVSFTF